MIYPSTAQTAAEVAGHYDSLDRFYREIWGEHVHHGLWRTGREEPAEAVESLVALVAERLAIRPGDAVCDVGCGYGATARMLAERWGADVVGVTLSEAQLSHARERGQGHNPRLYLRDWLDNGFAGESFDAVLSIESSEHMVDKPRFFAEVARTLRPGGRFVTCAWLAGEAPSCWQTRWLLEPICTEGRLPSLGSESEYRALIAAAGLTEISFEDRTRDVRRTWSICAARVCRRAVTDRRFRDFLRDPAHTDRRFALSVGRILGAYWAGAMRYGVFTARREGPSRR